MNWKQVVLAKLVRHALTVGGGAGLMSDDQVSQVAGALSTLLGIGWSIYEARQRQRVAHAGS